MTPMAACSLVFANQQLSSVRVLAVAAGALACLGVLAALALMLLRKYERLGSRSLERAYAGLQIHTSLAPGDVFLVYHTYQGFFAWGTETEHRVFLPLDDARELLGRLLRFNLTWGLLAHGGILVVPVAIWNYWLQRRSLTTQETGAAFSLEQSTATASAVMQWSRRRSWFHRVFGVLAAVLAGLFAVTVAFSLATRRFETAAGGALLSLLLRALAFDWLGTRRDS